MSEDKLPQIARRSKPLTDRECKLVANVLRRLADLLDAVNECPKRIGDEVTKFILLPALRRSKEVEHERRIDLRHRKATRESRS